MVKSNRNGQAATLTPEQLDAVMAELSPTARAVLSMCRFTAARVTEALSLRWENITQTEIIIPKAVTKKRMKTRMIPMSPRLWQELEDWKALWPAAFKRDPDRSELVFPGQKDQSKHLTRQCVDHALRAACKKLGIDGASTHSFRRSALTACSDKGIPLRVIQSLSGHSSLEMLQRYLDVKDEQKRQAALAFG